MARKKLDTLTEPMYYVLLSLTEERHGYGIRQYANQLTNGRVNVGAGTLYALLSRFEKEGLIRGYKAVVDWERIDNTHVSALIELKVTPKAGLGFEEVAMKVSQYPEVESVYLMSGGYDLSVTVTGKTFQEVAMFVAKELSTIDSVISTTTHFILRRYKELDVELIGKPSDDRGNFSL